MTALSEFEACNKPRIECQPASLEEVAPYDEGVPEMLIEHWKEVGWCGYADGAFWLTNPATYRTFIKQLPDFQDGLVIARTAFASLYIWKSDHLILYTPDNGKMTRVSSHLKIFFNTTCCSKLFRRDMLHLSEFRRVRRRLGPLMSDECYGYKLIPALGGSGDESTLTKVKILPYLEITRQALAG